MYGKSCDGPVSCFKWYQRVTFSECILLFLRWGFNAVRAERARLSTNKHFPARSGLGIAGWLLVSRFCSLTSKNDGLSIELKSFWCFDVDIIRWVAFLCRNQNRISHFPWLEDILKVIVDGKNKVDGFVLRECCFMVYCLFFVFVTFWNFVCLSLPIIYSGRPPTGEHDASKQEYLDKNSHRFLHPSCLACVHFVDEICRLDYRWDFNYPLTWLDNPFASFHILWIKDYDRVGRYPILALYWYGF